MVDIDVMIDPPGSGTFIWIIQVPYDQNVVEVVSCAPMTSPGGGIAQASSCDTKDTNGDTIHDTAVAFGGWVENDGGVPRGFETPQRAATFTFQAIGAAGSQSSLHVVVTSLLGPNGEVGSPAMYDGVIYIVTTPTATPSPTPPPVGGTVKVLTQSSGGSAGPTTAFLVVVVAAPLAVAYIARRRIIGR